MANITILGAGITGLSIAAILSKSRSKPYTITVVARDLPGDEPSTNWAGPCACAGWVALGGSPQEESMQLAALAYLRQLAIDHPESSVRSVKLTDVFPLGVTCADGTDTHGGVWFAGRVPDFEVLDQGHGLMEGAKVRYGSVVLTPGVFLPWLKRMLEEDGVRFEKVGEVASLGELMGTRMEHDVLINASGLGSTKLQDVKDEKVVSDRTYVTVVKSDFKAAFVKRGVGVYTYIFGRGDGTAVVGGVSEPVAKGVRSMEEIHEDLFRRAHENLPEHFPSFKPGDYEIVQDLVGIRPLRPAGVRVEKEVLNGQQMVHAYGTTIGGYIHCFGLAQEVARLVESVTD